MDFVRFLWSKIYHRRKWLFCGGISAVFRLTGLVTKVKAVQLSCHRSNFSWCRKSLDHWNQFLSCERLQPFKGVSNCFNQFFLTSSFHSTHFSIFSSSFCLRNAHRPSFHCKGNLWEPPSLQHFVQLLLFCLRTMSSFSFWENHLNRSGSLRRLPSTCPSDWPSSRPNY